LVAGEHVPDRLGELAGEVDLGDPGAALLAEPGLRSLVTLAIEGMGAGVDGGLDERPAQVLGALLGERAAAVGLARLVDARTEPGVAGELGRGREAADVTELSGDRVGETQPMPGRVSSKGT
jgi:hypothetical protein